LAASCATVAMEAVISAAMVERWVFWTVTVSWMSSGYEDGQSGRGVEWIRESFAWMERAEAVSWRFREKGTCSSGSVLGLGRGSPVHDQHSIERSGSQAYVGELGVLVDLLLDLLEDSGVQKGKVLSHCCGELLH
jgi:hypothetical protein